MSKRIALHVFVITVIATLTALNASAFSASKYATSSRLATGKWVKIQVNEDGMYQITSEELAQMGFSDPQSVRIYGEGGHPINEYLNGSATDDLKQIPVLRVKDKLCFYACGPVKYSLSTATAPHYTREINSYSTAGYYFLTCDDGSAPVQPTRVVNTGTGTTSINTSFDYFHHEQEISSASQSGKDMLGEMITDGALAIDYDIPNLCGDSTVVVNTCAVSKTAKAAFVKTSLNANEIAFTTASSRIYGSSSEYVFYNSVSPIAAYNPAPDATIPSDGTITVSIDCPDGASNIKWARLDYLILTFQHLNTMHGAKDGQLRMGYTNINSKSSIFINEASEDTQVWNIDNPSAPKTYNLVFDENTIRFSPSTSSTPCQFVAFDPGMKLKTIDGWANVENQNIHALPVPHMVIVTCEELLPQAQRVAQLHREHDNMIVHVIDQQKIFNEFSSGTPDAMAIRLMNKMFYDRDSQRFKFLLMFGAGNYDNRQIMAKRECTILTYESAGSSDESTSYVSDDFFGFMDDGSGRVPATELLRLAVGRIPCRNLTEAEHDVDKLINYVKNLDYGDWRNNAVFVGDYVDSETTPYLHIYQAEGISAIITDAQGAGLVGNKVYNSQYPTDPTSGFALEARNELTAHLNAGQYFMTYVGHAGPTSLTKNNKLWTSEQAKNVHYSHFPIMTAACCDVARFDCDQQGIVEMMFHNPNGGVIAAVASTRSAYADGNDALNQAFTKAMFSYGTNGVMTTVGEAYMLCKQSFGKLTNYNKMMFVLLGDPAIRINYPRPDFKITKINGRVPPSYGIATGPLQEVTVEAKVYKADGTTVNTSFNGNATMAIYSNSRLQTTFQNRNIYYPRNLLTKVSGRVVNGVFTARTVLPRFIQPSGLSLIKVYAHQDNSDYMVNGTYDNLVINIYDPNNSSNITDDTPPVINAMYINGPEAFANAEAIAGNCTLYVQATDNVAFNNHFHPMGNSMMVTLDGGKETFPLVKSYATMTNDAKTLDVAMPMQLEEGEHTLEFTAFDVAGNKASQTITFVVGSSSQVELKVEEEPAITRATFNLDSSFAHETAVEIKVLDIADNVVWTTTTSSFPCTWDLTNRRGKRVKPGVYKFHGRYLTGSGANGGTSIGHIIVAEPVKN